MFSSRTSLYAFSRCPYGHSRPSDSPALVASVDLDGLLADASESAASLSQYLDIVTLVHLIAHSKGNVRSLPVSLAIEACSTQTADLVACGTSSGLVLLFDGSDDSAFQVPIIHPGTVHLGHRDGAQVSRGILHNVVEH
ncbi:hypothetical protein GN244_ATG10892 [Phytophthora infestans]|uniref:Uncharacterized protein n=1 Tax=Phytophthora infestans TaxID=4787 RepID=A0A833WCC3_PHYIN|nr:hypothetical protein GN244_ATG10892 [Phytophthora infestans]